MPVYMGLIPEIIVVYPFSVSSSPGEPKNTCCVDPVPEHARSTVYGTKAYREWDIFPQRTQVIDTTVVAVTIAFAGATSSSSQLGDEAADLWEGLCSLFEVGWVYPEGGPMVVPIGGGGGVRPKIRREYENSLQTLSMSGRVALAAVDRPRHLGRVFIAHQTMTLFCVFRAALIRGYLS